MQVSRLSEINLTKSSYSIFILSAQKLFTYQNKILWQHYHRCLLWRDDANNVLCKWRYKAFNTGQSIFCLMKLLNCKFLVWNKNSLNLYEAYLTRTRLIRKKRNATYVEAILNNSLATLLKIKILREIKNTWMTIRQIWLRHNLFASIGSSIK